MPATEAETLADEQMLTSYELAYHVLPTVAEGEVTTVRDRIAAAITAASGVIQVEETPERIDLAYEIIKPIEGKNRRFTSAYFGWIRFTASADVVSAITDAVTTDKAVLRHLLIRLTKAEEALPFYYHEALANERQVQDVDVAEIEADIDPNVESEAVDTADVDDETAVESAGTDAVSEVTDSNATSEVEGAAEADSSTTAK